MEPTPTKLSLVALFDDFCRQFQEDSGDEEVFIEFLKKQEHWRQRWQAAEQEKLELKKKLAALYEAKSKLEGQLGQAKRILEKEVVRREKCEEELLATEQQLQLLREFLVNGSHRRDKEVTFQKQVGDGTEDATESRILEEPSGSGLSSSDASHEGDRRRSSRGKRRSSKGHHAK